ncbi:T9SS type A sorting domain-containing protein [Rhodocaloribacter litoris]|uniref:T9SS type A sorting domain-containing protein n=1 Tax=Rhodocaloribacter litoris TaxID=2558931 RepID=UPI00141F29DE|nr:T9SS type A sorting domain-containing protein [Rhodocaloribacter litoris]QXD14463.1 T9SS type A sorting domain-containing protein [Rhodocaloribacter litoris]
MRKTVTTRSVGAALLGMFMGVLLAAPVRAQSEGDYRTRDSGNWSNAQIWERFNGSAWVAVATPPSGSEVITVREADSVYVDVETTLTGHLVNQGIVDTDSLLTIGDGGVYEHARDEGKIPRVIWAEGSTLLMTGVVATAPADRNQNYYHVTFNTPGLLSNLNMALDEATIGGDIRVLDTGLARWYLTTASPNDTSTVTIMGNVYVENGAFSVHGTSNAGTTFIVHHYGNIEVTGGNFSISRGSQGLGTTTWYLYEGDFFMANATTQSSTITPGGAKFVFARQGRQTLTLENVEFSALPIEVSSGTTLDMGLSKLGGSGDFTLKEGAGLATALPGGVAEIFTDVAGVVTLEDNASFEFNGTEAQVTSTAMPAVVQDLVIDNAAGVTLSQETTINGVLVLRAGVFDNTIPFTLGSGASISFEGGSLLIPVASEVEGELPRVFFVDQNYPNPFSTSTVIRYGLPVASEVTVRVYDLLGREVRTVHEGSKPAGVHEVVLEARELGAGLYLYRVESAGRSVSRQMVVIR